MKRFLRTLMSGYLISIIALSIGYWFLSVHAVKEFDYQSIVVDTSDKNKEFYEDCNRRCTMDYAEYEEFCDRYDIKKKYDNTDCSYVICAYSVISNMENDLKKTEDYEGAMRELEILGWSEETKQVILTALDYYRQHEGIDRLK